LLRQWRRIAAPVLDKETGTHESLAPTLHNFAGLLLDKGESEQAEALYRHALATNEQAFGPDDPSVALTLADLGTLLQERGDYSGTEALYKRALRIHRSRLGPLNAYVGTDLANLALLSKIQGYFAKAEPLYRQALAIQEKALGSDHPKIATDLNNLASLLRKVSQAHVSVLWGIPPKLSGPRKTAVLFCRRTLLMVNKSNYMSK